MRDRVRIIYGALGAFSTARWGFLRVKDGKVVIDIPRLFNMAAAMLNAGANCFRIFLRNTWGVEVEYDWRTPGYWQTLREFLAILHQPYQNDGTGEGTEILVELFDNCNPDDKALMNDPARYEEGRQRIRDAFANLGDLDYVKFRAGNEAPKGNSLAFFKEVILPVFNDAGRVPYSYSQCYETWTPAWDGPVERQKRAAETVWDELTALAIFRVLHSIKDSTTADLQEIVGYWVHDGNNILVEISDDGVMDGTNPCDKTLSPTGAMQARPSEAEFESAIDYLLSNAPTLMYNGKSKYGIEHCGKKPDDDDNECIPRMIAAIARCYQRRTGEQPFNKGRYPDRWIKPEPPTPPEPPAPPPAPDCKCRHWLTESKRPDIWRWIKCLFGGKKRCK